MTNVVRIPRRRLEQWNKIKESIEKNTFFKSKIENTEVKSDSIILDTLIDSYFRRDYFRIEKKIEENTKELKTLQTEIIKLQTLLLLTLSNTNKIKEIKTIIEDLSKIFNVKNIRGILNEY